ncbi:MAG: adenine deaminase [Spirochaetia bacterium]|nr:adenine deaminase [Spirochaetia bacterium]MCF7946485.1 adenine deaminase [Spirochaetia bacterium]
MIIGGFILTELKKETIDIAAGRKKAELVIKNANIVNVFSAEIVFGNLAVHKGKIIGIGSYEGNQEIDAECKYIIPGLIDAHVHIESSLLSPERFAEMILPKGTTSIIADPHEIANVCGLKGVNYMLDSTEHLPVNTFFMIPSCVPAAEFENSGAVLTNKEIESVMDQERVLGLGEMMDYPGLISGKKEVIDKINTAKKSGKQIDGHSPLLEGKELTAYAASGVKTDHECSTVEEMKERINRGMHVLLREGSAARNLTDLLKGVNRNNSRRCLFCTDDRQPQDILQEGHINNHLRIAVSQGIDPAAAVQMATINAAECYGLTWKGAVAPGYDADFVIVDDLKDFNPAAVFVNGELAAENGKILKKIPIRKNRDVLNTVSIKEFSIDDIALKLNTSDVVKVIKLSPHSLFTESAARKVDRDENNTFLFNKHLDILKLVVVERHKKTGNIGIGLVENYKMRGGAIATSIAHDSHNIIAVGDSDIDIYGAVKEIERINGGIAICSEGKILHSLPLPIAGLMSSLKPEELQAELTVMQEIAFNKLHVNKELDPFMTLSFLALPVIPQLKLTDQGLFDVLQFTFTDICIKS